MSLRFLMNGGEEEPANRKDPGTTMAKAPSTPPSLLGKSTQCWMFPTGAKWRSSAVDDTTYEYTNPDIPDSVTGTTYTRITAYY